MPLCLSATVILSSSELRGAHSMYGQCSSITILKGLRHHSLRFCASLERELAGSCAENWAVFALATAQFVFGTD